MVQAYLLSLLKRQHLLLGKGFVARYPHAWLVWEPGEWSVPRSQGEAEAGRTRLPQPSGPARPRAGDALCFALRVDAGRDAQLTLGRAPTNDLVLNDMTVSRTHLRFSYALGNWSVRLELGAHGVTRVAGEPLVAGAGPRLRPGTGVEVGGLRLTYYDAEAFAGRLASA